MNPRPHNVEAERALLGGVLTSPDRIVDIAATVAPRMFYRPDHGHLFALLLAMQAEGEVIDMVTLPARLMGNDKGEHFGGVAYVCELPDYCPATANLGHYAEEVSADWRRRTFLDVAEKAIADVQQGAEPADAIGRIDRVVSAMDNGAAQWTTYAAEADDVVEEIERREVSRKSGGEAHPSTGYPAVDKIIGGLEAGRVYVLAARPAMGKSALAQCIANYRADTHAEAVLLHSMEMPAAQVAERAIMQMGYADAARARDGFLAANDEGWGRVRDGRSIIQNMPVYVDDRPSLTIEQISASAKYHRAKHGIKLLVVDYLQLIEGQGNDRRAVVEHASRGLKKVAMQLGIPVLVLSQLSRACEQRPDKRPMLSDLRETGAIEQDADAVLMLYRPGYYDPDGHPPDSHGSEPVEVLVRKCRAGSPGSTVLDFRGRSVAFLNRGEAATLLLEGS